MERLATCSLSSPSLFGGSLSTMSSVEPTVRLTVIPRVPCATHRQSSGSGARREREEESSRRIRRGGRGGQDTGGEPELRRAIIEAQAVPALGVPEERGYLGSHAPRTKDG
jgi:hypothetical protein